MLIIDVASQVLSLLIMAGGFVLLLELARESPSSVKEAGLQQHEALFLAVGGFAGLLFSIPVFLMGSSLLALNIGGAIVPMSISLYLLGRRLGRTCLVMYVSILCGFTILFAHDATYPVRLANAQPTLPVAYAAVAIPLAFVVASARSGRKTGYALSLSLLSFVVIAYLTFYTTSFDPSLGIISEFPYFLLPMLVPPLIAIVAFRHDLSMASAAAYSSGSLGVMVGADIVRVPVLVTQQGIVGAIGGAGGLDLIYLSGLVSISLVILYAYLAKGRSSVALSPYRYHLQMSRDRMKGSIRAARGGRFDEAISLAMRSVDERALAYQARTGSKGDAAECIYAMGMGDQKKYDYWLMHVAFAGKNDKGSAVRAIVTASNLNRAIMRAECARGNLASIQDRLIAFVVDLVIFLAVFVPFGIYVLSNYQYSLMGVLTDVQSPVPTAYLLLATSFLIVYGFVFETIWGRTPGKWLAKIKVVRDDGAPISVIDSLMRNVVRAVDFLPVGYFIGGITMYYSPYGQRLGDMIGRTVVVRG
jgi:uncharacterized RDD family membrane protein YckC/uncharacterized membrane protein